MRHLVGQDAHHEIVADNAAAHAPVAEKREPAEHLSLGDIASAGKSVAHALGQQVVKRYVALDHTA
ncbi:MAG TPA: hypothetical protein VNR64_12115 [Vicinamibacterales bacterium]|nr:hypothetical protein [Vicinamibacterales bacterium]